MKSETHKPASSLTGDRQLPNTFGSFFLRAFWIALGATLLIFLMFFSQGFFKLSETGQRLVAIFVYSVCIALPSMVLLTQVSIRYAATFARAIIFIQALCLVGTASLGTLAAVFVLWIAGVEGRGGYWNAYWAILPFSIVISLAIGMSVTTYETLRYKLQAATLEARTRQMEQERAYKLLAEAQLSSLESRIHPHFLFNTLNSIAALIPSNPQLAEDTVGKLARAARERGLGLMVGCMAGSSLAIAPAFVVGCLVDLVDIDGPLLLKRDRIPGLAYSRGRVEPPPAAGAEGKAPRAELDGSGRHAVENVRIAPTRRENSTAICGMCSFKPAVVPKTATVPPVPAYAPAMRRPRSGSLRSLWKRLPDDGVNRRNHGAARGRSQERRATPAKGEPKMVSAMLKFKTIEC